MFRPKDGAVESRYDVCLEIKKIRSVRVMEEMVEPDRTITIVSIVGLIIIWGSVAYHKFVQSNGAEAPSKDSVKVGGDSGNDGGKNP